MLVDKLIDHNLIYDHNIFVFQEIINSGMMLINTDILKSFVDDRNSFIFKERKKLRLHINVIPILNKLLNTSNLDERKENDSSDLKMSYLQEDEETSTITPTNISTTMPLNTIVHQHMEMNTQTNVQTFE